jgi:hypothetical protein
MKASVASVMANPVLDPITTSGKRIEIISDRIGSMRKRVKWVGNYFQNRVPGKVAMLTLTYAEAGDWHGRHVSDLLVHIRKWLKRKGHTLRYVWVAELQKRGAVHYHVCLWLPKGLTLPKPDKQGWWPHGFTNIKWARSAVKYCMKYVSKLESKDVRFPRGMRLHGSGGLEADARTTKTWTFMPLWLQRQTTPLCKVGRVQGGGWVSRVNGEFFKSPYKVLYFVFRPGIGRIAIIEMAAEEIPC